MLKKTKSFAGLLLCLGCCANFLLTNAQAPLHRSAPGQSPSPIRKWLLKDNWKMQSALTDLSTGADISTDSFDPKDWYPVTIPTTIIGGLLANKVYPFDPLMGQNLKKLIDPKLDKGWWFRRELSLPLAVKGKHTILRLHGVNYTANVWLNGTKIADSTAIKGPFRVFEMDVTTYIRPGKRNVLALEITRPFRPNRDRGDLAIDYADWIPDPPDFNGGIVNDVELIEYNKIGIEYPEVTTQFDLPSLKIAHLGVNVRLTNYENTPQDAELTGIIEGPVHGAIRFVKRVHLEPLEIMNVHWDPATTPQLNVKDPRIWWPWQYGKPDLNHISLSVFTPGGPGKIRSLSNSVAENFGIRQMDSKLIDSESREFIVNGQPILIRGAAWSPDIFQRRSEQRQEQEIRLVRDMNMNIVRSEGKLEDDHFYELCDKYGLLVMTGWMCCGAWQHPEHWSVAERNVALASDSSVMYWLRNKASVMVWLNGSDMPPTDSSLERQYLDIEHSLNWPNPLVSTADGTKSKVSGFSGVKMLGPYEWVPPIYWETDTTHHFGGAWSFATEISPGPSIPPYESLVKFIPADSLAARNFSSSEDWHYHSGTGFFATTDIFNKALASRYGSWKSIRNYAAKAQAQNYEAQRAMMESYGLHKYNTATGVVQWMLSNPWPGLIWHTYDYYLYPGGSYFGMKKGMEPLQAVYSYPTHSVAIVNSFRKEFPSLDVQATIFNLDGSRPFEKAITTGLAADSAKTCFSLPSLSGLSDTYFLRLEIKEKSPGIAGGKTRNINWYWLSKTGDTLNWKKSNWYTTPQSAYMDYSALQQMPKTKLEVSVGRHISPDTITHQITLKNTGNAVAFFVHLRALAGKNGPDILPVIFEDNYILLAPGETRTIRCSYAAGKDAAKAPFFLVSGWNLDSTGSHGTPGSETGFEDGLPQ